MLPWSPPPTVAPPAPTVDTIATPPTPQTFTLQDVVMQLAALRTEIADALYRLAPGTPAAVSTYALATSLFVKPTRGTLYSLRGFNTNAATRFIQCFDSRDSSSVPSEGAIPQHSEQVAGTSAFNIDFTTRGWLFENGLWIIFSTTGPTKTIGAAEMWCTARYL